MKDFHNKNFRPNCGYIVISTKRMNKKRYLVTSLHLADSLSWMAIFIGFRAALEHGPKRYYGEKIVA